MYIWPENVAEGDSDPIASNQKLYVYLFILTNVVVTNKNMSIIGLCQQEAKEC